jgi:hypothetical protein
MTTFVIIFNFYNKSGLAYTWPVCSHRRPVFNAPPLSFKKNAQKMFMLFSLTKLLLLFAVGEFFGEGAQCSAKLSTKKTAVISDFQQKGGIVKGLN